mmetsp:Transcript_573/g.1132  ORF Transcript_573/g.1132 Transcript_573/m.1132 type:complete len:264 (+) Transcript_573:1-792(+)
MVKTLCRAGVSVEIVQRLLQTQQTFFPEHSINWQMVSRELLVGCLVGCDSYERFSSIWSRMMEAFSASQAHQELIQSLLEIQQSFFPDQNNTNWQIVCEELVRPLKGWWQPEPSDPELPKNTSLKIFRSLVMCSIAERLNAVGVRKWRMKWLMYIENLAKRGHSMRYHELVPHFDSVHLKLVTYEQEFSQLKDAMSLLELAIWKSKLDESVPMMQYNNAGKKRKTNDHFDMKRQCRIRCGAGVILPNVLPYLIGNGEGGNDDD